MFKVPYTTFPACNCEVHAGFYKLVKADMDAVAAEVARLLDLYGPATKVQLTGHSLGAALAQMASLELLARGLPVDAVYNFGQVGG